MERAMDTEIQGRAAHSAAIRERAVADMAAMGVDEAFVDRLVETFYGRVLAHPELGPVFDAGFPAGGRSIWRR
jgi:hemoglobin